MRITYDSETDAITIYLREGQIEAARHQEIVEDRPTFLLSMSPMLVDCLVQRFDPIPGREVSTFFWLSLHDYAPVIEWTELRHEIITGRSP